MQVLDEKEKLERHTRGNRKMKTYTAQSSTGERLDEIKVSAQALAELHRMHEEWRKSIHRREDDTSEEAMEAAWKISGWSAYGDGPWLREKAFHDRKLKFYPAGFSEAAFKQWDGAVINTKGQKRIGETTPGQDNCSVSMLPDDWIVLCVMDGHGPGGHWPANRSVRTVPFFLQAGGCYQMLKQGETQAALINAFRKAQADLEYQAFEEDVEIQVAGCTAVCACYQPKKRKVWVATVGDSRAILLDVGKGVVAETKDHKPSVPAERARVEANGCDVIITEYEDGWREERINISGTEYPGISMSRSFGDCLVKEYGVIAEPDVVEWSLEELEKPYIFAASDGVWEFLETKQVASILLDSIIAGSSLQEACKTVLHRSREKWSDYEETYCDDITLILMPLQGAQRIRNGATDGCCAGITRSCSIS